VAYFYTALMAQFVAALDTRPANIFRAFCLDMAVSTLARRVGPRPIGAGYRQTGLTIPPNRLFSRITFTP